MSPPTDPATALSLLASFLKAGFRGMRSSPVFAIGGMLSLATGIAVWLLLLLLVRDQQRYDSFHPDADRIVRVTSTSWNPSIDLMVPLASSPAGSAEALLTGLPDVEAATRVARIPASVMAEHGRVSVDALAAEPSFLEMFDFGLLAGDPETVLTRPGAIVLTEEVALRLTGEPRPVGRVLDLGSIGLFQVTGILAAPPRHTHLRFEALLSLSSWAEATGQGLPRLTASLTDWTDTGQFWTYVRLRDRASRSSAEAEANRLLRARYPESARGEYAFQLEPLRRIVLVDSDLGNQIAPVIGSRPLYVVSVFGLMILLIASFNYVGLAVSRSVRRSREVGVRKALGASRGQVAQQFLAEAVLSSIGALLLAMVAIIWIAPVFNNLRFMRLSGVTVAAGGLWDGGLLALALAVAVGAGLLAGLLPALHLSRFHPAAVLSGSFRAARGGRWSLRRILVSAQFAAAVLFLVAATAIWRQVDAMMDADYGFERTGLVAVDLQDTALSRFRDAAGSVPAIRGIAAASSLPVAGGKSLTYLQSEGVAAPLFTYWYSIDHAFLDQLALSLVAGRNFDPSRASDSTQSIILNETSARELGFESPARAVGSMVRVGLREGRQSGFEVVGVVRDFYFENNKDRIRRLALFHDPSAWQYAVVNSASDPGETIAGLRDVWAGLGSDVPLKAETFTGMLTEELAPTRDARMLITIVAAIAILLSCMGLVSFAAFSAQARRHEVGVRKVVGATAGQVVRLLVGDMARLMLLGVAVAAPLMVMAGSAIANNFPVQADQGLVQVLIPVAFAVGLGLLVTLAQVLRAALLDPVSAIQR